MKPGVYWLKHEVDERYNRIIDIVGHHPFLQVKWACWADDGEPCNITEYDGFIARGQLKIGPHVMTLHHLPENKVLVMWKDEGWKGCLVSPEAIFPVSHDITEADDPHLLIAKLVEGEE